MVVKVGTAVVANSVRTARSYACAHALACTHMRAVYDACTQDFFILALIRGSDEHVCKSCA